MNLIFNINLDNLKKTVNNLFAITINIQGGFLYKKPSETFKRNPWKINTSERSSFSVRLQGSQNQLFARIFQGFC